MGCCAILILTGAQVVIHHRGLAWATECTKRLCSNPKCDSAFQWDADDVRAFRYTKNQAITYEVLVEHMFATVVIGVLLVWV